MVKMMNKGLFGRINGCQKPDEKFEKLVKIWETDRGFRLLEVSLL